MISLKTIGDLTMESTNVFAGLLCPEQDNIKVRIEDVQQQKDGASCGLYAVAFATSLALGLDSRLQAFVYKSLRPRLIDKCSR